MIDSTTDVWGEAAMRQPEGASYEFFEPLLPAPRYVNADFRYYPLVLAAPNSAVKARLVSNGSGINLRGGATSWRDVGVPLVFRVGPDLFRFGDLRDRVGLPELADGYLPIVEIQYSHPQPYRTEGHVPLDQPRSNRAPEVYRLEAFASTDPALAAKGVVFVSFSLSQGTEGVITLQNEGSQSLHFKDGRIVNGEGQVVAVCSKNWVEAAGGARHRLTGQDSATLAVATVPWSPPSSLVMDDGAYELHRAQAGLTWKTMLDRAMQVEVPEPRVNAAWRNLLIQNFALLNQDRIFYSAGNQYEKLYEAEGSEAALAMLAWGYEEDYRRMLLPLLDFTRKGLEYHIAGFKLNDVCRYYWQTRDAQFVQSIRSRWEKELGRILDNRTGENGLFPKEQYCGDIYTPVYSLNANSRAWRAIVDMAAMLESMGDADKAAALRDVAAQYKPQILDALHKSIRRETSPPFVPLALLSEEPVHSPITATRIGSYWNIVVGYTMAARLFPAGSPEENWIPQYQETHGGVCMGMIRSGGSAHGFWTGADRVNPLYGLRYTVDALRRDDPDRALVSFYGMLAQGLTRNTLVGGEGCTLRPVDDGGRFFYCPPNTAANAFILVVLRNLLVQDWDADDDGAPDTLRLLFATPRRWLQDGQSITVERAPTAFGPVSVHAVSRLRQGHVEVQVQLPDRQAPKRTLLRIRLPGGWRVSGATIEGTLLPLADSDTVDLTGRRGSSAVRFAVEQMDGRQSKLSPKDN